MNWDAIGEVIIYSLIWIALIYGLIIIIKDRKK